MSDRLSKEMRSRLMAKVGRKNTKPELLVRKALFGAGFRYRLQVKSLPGTPDIVLPKYKMVVFVNGCFWHAHPGCKRARLPEANHAFWEGKIHRNIERDKKTKQELEMKGWRVITVWECETKDMIALRRKLNLLIKENF